MNRDAIIRYGQIKAEIKRLEDELEFIKPEVEKDIKEAIPEPGNNYVSFPEIEHLGKFGLVKSKAKWQYSMVIQEIEADLKEQKDEEVAKGTAINLNEDKYEIRFIVNKE